MEHVAINELLMKMTETVKESIENSLICFKKFDKELAQRIIEKDEEINQLELAIDEKCFTHLSAKAFDFLSLRFIVSSLKIIMDLERIGDLNVNIAQEVLEIDDKLLKKVPISIFKDLFEMGDLTYSAFEIMSEALEEKNGDAIRKIWEIEDKVDNLRESIRKALEDEAQKDAAIVDVYFSILLISRFWERMSDHIVNIAEEIAFIAANKILRHKDRSRLN